MTSSAGASVGPVQRHHVEIAGNFQQAESGALRIWLQWMAIIIALDPAAFLEHRLGRPQAAVPVPVIDQWQALLPFFQRCLFVAGKMVPAFMRKVWAGWWSTSPIR